MSRGIVGFIIGLIAVLGGAFVATLLLKNKLTEKDDDLSDFDSFDDPIDDEEFESFFADDDLPDDAAGTIPGINDDDDDKEEQL